jgi:hypothetical protein
MSSLRKTTVLVWLMMCVEFAEETIQHVEAVLMLQRVTMMLQRQLTMVLVRKMMCVVCVAETEQVVPVVQTLKLVITMLPLLKMMDLVFSVEQA